MTAATRNSSARRMTLARRADIIDHMMMSLHTHVALTYLGEQDHQRAAKRRHEVERDDRYRQTPTSVRRMRRRLARMHLAPAGS
jgi:hypothetical protein